MAALKRLSKEHRRILEGSSSYISAEPRDSENLFDWTGII